MQRRELTALATFVIKQRKVWLSLNQRSAFRVQGEHLFARLTAQLWQCGCASQSIYHSLLSIITVAQWYGCNSPFARLTALVWQCGFTLIDLSLTAVYSQQNRIDFKGYSDLTTQQDGYIPKC